ncbi:aldo/keto reductase [Curtobacterium sp. ISL-83]|uniref:aldo/keto reductase n=1 Tax=Curtobacterium sp. ISL-83 TaxID=2819145 RepID=UPI001BEBDA01|nr:aldo/keto reductase [Curtobacterium sp. ISL-83]MBT2503888.1 aldo/keto reductase [Curtobacterium sp. ISL-83]
MQSRTLGRTGRTVSVIGLGTWQFGGDWGPVTESDANAVMDASVESGVTLFDTADVYGDGRSEQLIGRWRRANADVPLTITTKMGRRADQVPSNYVAANFREWVDRSRTNLGQDTLDLVQLHCPPTPVYEDDAVYDALDALVADGSIAAYGVSVETTDQALTAIARPGVATVQIILNAFRLKPLDRVLPAALEAGVGILARVPLASGLLSGKYTPDTEFAPEDHRSYNRHGEAFDQGETFSGVDFEDGVRAAQAFAESLPQGVSVPQAAIAWIVAQPGVTAAIPGARNPEQARSNAGAGDLPEVPGLDATVRDLYDTWFRATVHERW